MMKITRYECLSFGAGAMMSLAFAPYRIWLLGVLSLSALSFLWLNPHRQRPMADGFWFGLGYFGVGLHWVYISMYKYGNASLSFALAANALLIGLLALYPVLLGWLLKRFTHPNTFARALSIPWLWIGLEYGRAHWFTGFPWLSVGYTQTTAPLQSLAPIGGVWLVGLALMALSALLALSVVRRSLVIATNTVLLALVLSALKELKYTYPIGEPLSIALVQANIEQTTKFDREHIEKNINIHRYLSENRHEKIIVWPETAITYFESLVRDSLLAELDHDFKQRRQTLITGIPTGNLDQKEYYNGAIALGVGYGQYRKHHLLPFGEYVPLRSLLERFRNTVEIPLGDFSRGAEQQRPLWSHGVAAGLSICFEAAFGRHIRQSLPQARYLINLSNDGWFKGSIAYDQHLQMNQMRALEMGRDLARATNTGLTVIINARGQIVSELTRDVAGVLSGEVQPRIGSTPYARFGNRVIEGVWLVWGLLLLLMARTRRKTM